MPNMDSKNTAPTISSESAVWDAFRNGLWKRPANPYFFSTTQFPKSPYAVDQFFRQQTPDTGEEPRTDEHRAFMGRTMAKLLERTGSAILMTHSNSGQYGWASLMETPDKIKAVVAYEPGRVVFPDSEILENIPTGVEIINQVLAPQLVSMEEFKKLTKMPILIVYGDNISTQLTDVYRSELWRIARIRAKQFVDAVNRNGGDAKLILLNEVGIYGNTHSPFADLNNIEITDLLEKFLKEKGLDGRNTPHKGPVLNDLKEYTIPITKQ